METIAISLGLGLAIAMLLLALVTAFIPAIIAGVRQHPHTWLIFFVVLLTSWSMIGWVIALIWSLMPFEKIEEMKTELTLSEKLTELLLLFENNMITQDEYNEKRRLVLENS
jgi:hypothetical protein